MHDDGPSIWSGPYLAVTIANLTIVSLAAFDGLAVIAALPSIAADLGRVSLLPWVITGYIGASAVAVIVAGPVVDALGARAVFRFSGVWFLATSALVAVAPTMPVLLAARVAQGLGGGLVIAVALSAVGLVYPPPLRPRAFAANSSVWGVMGVGGPAIAATLLAFSGWRMVFVAQLPLAVLALLMAWNGLPDKAGGPRRVVTDFRGVALLGVLAFASLLALDQLRTRPLLAAVFALITLLVGVVYWRYSGSQPNPVLERRHLTRAPLRWIHLTVGLVLAAGLAADNFLPLYLQITRGRSPAFSAFSVVFLAVGWTTASIIYAQIADYWSEAKAIMLGAAMIVPALTLSGATIAFNAPLWAVFGAFFAVGMSIGFVSTAGLTLMQNTSEEEEMGRVNAAHQFLRTLAITYGIAIGGAVLLFVVDRRLGDVEQVRAVLDGQSAIENREQAGEAIRSGLVWATAAAALLGLGVVAAALSLRRSMATEQVGQTTNHP